MQDHERNSWPIWLLIGAHLLIAVPLAWYLNIWSDEASSLYSTEHGFLHAFQNAATFERQAPLYFWLLSIWREFNGSVFFARIPSIGASVLSIWLFARFAARYLGRRGTFLAASFFALHPILIWASTEIRVYAFVILLSVLLSGFFFRGFLDKEATRPSRILFTIAAIVAVYLNYYLGFILIGFFAALLLTRRWRPARDYLLLMLIVAVALGPLALSIWSQFGVNSASFNDERTLVTGLRQLWDHVLTYLLPADIVVVESSPVAFVRLWIVRLFIAGIVLLAAFRFRRLSRETIALNAATFGVLACLLAAYFLLGRELTLLRHATVVFVPLILSVAFLMRDLVPIKAGRWAGLLDFAYPAVAVLVLGFFGYALVTRYNLLAKPGDWSRIGSYLEQHESAGQPIVIFHTYDALALPYQYHGVNRIVPDERFLDFDFALPTPQLIRDRTAFTISKIPADATQIWLIQSSECNTPGICDQFEDYIRENFDQESEQSFYQQRVRLLRRR